jgi:hypothetical protein
VGAGFAPRFSVPAHPRRLGRVLADSNSSISYFDFPVFSVIWGICFSLEANLNGIKRSDSGPLLAQGAHLPDTNM